MNFQIRLSKFEDSKKILEVQANSLRNLSSSYSSIQIDSLIRGQAAVRFKGDEIIVVAEYENEVIGFACIAADKPSIAGVYVHPNFIRRGIGSQLLEALEKIAIERRDETINVLSSLATENFYRANGYQLIRKSGFHSERTTWIPCVNLKKELIHVSRTKKLYRQVCTFLPILSRLFILILCIVAAVLVVFLLPLLISWIMSLF
jgi:GNAT superfamily N-acetyltransferase